MTNYEERLERDLGKLAKRVKRMGSAVVGAVRSATKSALTQDGDLANQTILGDLPIRGSFAFGGPSGTTRFRR